MGLLYVLANLVILCIILCTYL